ncbi:hypothetical protein [Cellulomonas sp. URHB0016]
MRSSRRLLAVPATVALVWALAACGGGAPAAEEAAPTGTAVATQDPEPAPEAATITAANIVETLSAAQQDAGSYDFAMTTTAQGQSIASSGSARVTGDTQELSMTMTIPGAGETAMRLVGGMLYMNMGDVTGGKFVQIDPSDPSNPLAATVDQLTSGLDPNKGMAGQKEAIVSVTKKGAPEQLDGVAAQPYELVIDPSKIVGTERATLDQAAAAGIAVPETITYTYWIGPDDLLRKMTFDLVGGHTEMTFTGWGHGGEIVAPTADEIATENPFGA